jgi:23S rRNA (adenine1618-N6)-methyltransferase
VGASCIYPLLGTAFRPNWSFSGTELDPESYDWATRNVELNDLSSRITLHKVDVGASKLIPLDRMGTGSDGEVHVDFLMCNPPFFTSESDMSATFTNKKEPPSAICTGASVEMIYEQGGDLGFAVNLANESKVLGQRIQWYTCMLGKLQSALELVTHIKSLRCDNWAVGTLIAGSRTRRWVIGWSWANYRPFNVSLCGLFIVPGGKSLDPCIAIIELSVRFLNE